MMRANDLRVDDVASAFFTTTRDLTAEFPAVAANKMGFTDIALMCGHEMEVPGSLPMCLRILLHGNPATDADPLVPTDPARSPYSGHPKTEAKTRSVAYTTQTTSPIITLPPSSPVPRTNTNSRFAPVYGIHVRATVGIIRGFLYLLAQYTPDIM